MTNYYENKKGELFVDPIVANHTDLNKISAKDFDAKLAILNAPQPITVVGMAQARLALLQAGHLGKVQLIIDAMPEPQKSAAIIEWEYRARVRRDSPLVQVLAAQIPLSETEMDALFQAASEL